MKKLLTIIAAGAFAFVGTSGTLEARPYGGNGYHHQTTTYVSGYRHGRPIYTQKIFVGYDRCGTPRFTYRTLATQSFRGNKRFRGNNSCGTNFRNNQHSGYRYDKRRHSNSQVILRWGR